jgi:thymidine kinase
LCFADNVTNIEQQMYKLLDDAVLEFAATNHIPPYREVIDGLWEEIKTRPIDGHSGIPFFIEPLNEFATIDAGELFLIGGKEKSGKSMMLLQIAVDMMAKGKKVLYVDSELNSRMFTARLLAHMTRTEFKYIRSGKYSKETLGKIDLAVERLKTKDFTHIYLPMFDPQSLYTTVKKVFHTQGIDVLIIDYFKSSGGGDAYENYSKLGEITDMVKNSICGAMNIAGVGAVQLTATGKIADSAKIGRNVSTVAFLQAKTPEEIEADGDDCGNTKLRVGINRNGRQQGDDEYIDLTFNGNLIRYDVARQHAPSEPY